MLAVSHKVAICHDKSGPHTPNSGGSVFRQGHVNGILDFLNIQETAPDVCFLVCGWGSV